MIEIVTTDGILALMYGYVPEFYAISYFVSWTV